MSFIIFVIVFLFIRLTKFIHSARKFSNRLADQTYFRGVPLFYAFSKLRCISFTLLVLKNFCYPLCNFSSHLRNSVFVLFYPIASLFFDLDSAFDALEIYISAHIEVKRYLIAVRPNIVCLYHAIILMC